MKWSKKDWRFWRVGQKYDRLLEMYVDLQAECAGLQELNSGLFQRAAAQHRALCSMEKQKATLQLRIEELENCHDHHSWTRCETEIKALKARIAELEEERNDMDKDRNQAWQRVRELEKEQHDDAIRPRTWDYQ